MKQNKMTQKASWPAPDPTRAAQEWRERNRRAATPAARSGAEAVNAMDLLNRTQLLRLGAGRLHPSPTMRFTQ
jgi:hypothetical protein